VAFIILQRTPVDPAQAPAHVHLRDVGSGPPLVFLHGGWGYEAYPFENAATALADARRVIAPDRVGYGGSGRPLRELPDRFHPRMAEETMLVLDELGIRSAVLWGHSDGAVVALWAAILHPDRVQGLLLEALHFVAAKVRSVEFFRTAVEAPERFGEATVRALERDHGAAWRDVIGAGGRAWLRIIEEGVRGRADLYDGRAKEVRAPALLLHGTRDPRTEPGELDAALAALPDARLELLDAAHSPHTSSVSAERCLATARRFLDELARSSPGAPAPPALAGATGAVGEVP
jgi:pimeloyl-ACP methyl ester carboxylesterase